MNEINQNKINLTPSQIDTLKELGNIGSGNAIVALSTLLNKRVEMYLTDLKLIPFWKFSDIFENKEVEYFGISSKIQDDNEFRILQLYTKASMIKIINDLTDFEKIDIEDIKNIKDLDSYSLSIISEMGNILAGNFTSALSDLLSISLMPEIPDLALDVIDAISNSVIANFTQELDNILVIDTSLKIEALELRGYICFIPSMEAVKILLEKVSQKFDT